ncbi:MAG: SGNH/GDSL hydrolase family protein [Candidatus Hydrogenedentota bacterium]
MRGGFLLMMALGIAVRCVAVNGEALNPRPDNADVPLTAKGGTWYAHIDAPRDAFTVRFVRAPESVSLVRTGDALPYTHTDDTLTVSLPADIAAGARVAIVFEENRWAETMAWFARQDEKEPPPEAAVLFVGSSSIRGWNLDESFPDRRTINRGFGGSAYGDMLRFAHRLFKPYAPRAVVLYSGDNDIAAGKSAPWVFADCRALIARIRHDLPEVPVFVLGIKPSIARWALWPAMQAANERIAQYCATAENVTYIDSGAPLLDDAGKPDAALFRDDGLHLNDAGYAKWNALVRPLLE